MSDFAVELYDLGEGGGADGALGPGVLVLDAGAGDPLGYSEADGALPPYANIVADDIEDDHYWNASASNWYSQIWVVLGPTMPWGPLLPPFVPGPNVTAGSTATPRQIRSVKRQALKWKSPHAYPVKVILRFPGQVLPGPHLKPPFLLPAPAQRCTWNMGKIVRDTVFTPPFVPGGYEV